MGANAHLFEHFAASKETRDRGESLYRSVRLRTGPGSGYDVGELTPGLPAACMVIASEQLQNTEVTKKSAQGASCLNSRSFTKVLGIVQTIVDENEKASNITYAQLHSRHMSGFTLEALKEFIIEMENEVIPRAGNNNLMRCCVFFWVLNCVKPRALPSTEAFAQQYDLPAKKFISILGTMNDHCKGTRKRILAHFKNKASDTTSPTAPTPRQSPRKMTSLRELPSNDSPRKRDAKPEATEDDQSSPVRRSSRSTASLYGTNSSPTKSGPPPPWKKGPQRDLPSRDSPKKPKAVIQVERDDEDAPGADQLPQTPSKKRKVDSPSKYSQHSSTAAAVTTPSSSRPLGQQSPTKKNLQPVALFPSAPSRSSPLKRSHEEAAATDLPSDSDESDMEEPLPKRRFRPVYLEQKQWNARDPRIARMWRKALKVAATSEERTGPSNPVKARRKAT